MAEEVVVVPTPVNPVQIKGAIAFSAEHARVWAEGTDEEVEELGGEHSAKGWANSVGEEGKDYTDEQIALAKTELTDQMNAQSLITLDNAKSYTDTEVLAEANNRQDADNNLQSQIDAITVSSDVFDVVGTYQDLLDYDTTTVPVNDIIKVLSDSTHDDAASYYRWDGEEWDYIGSEGPYYTKSEADSVFLTQSNAAETYASISALDAKQDVISDLATIRSGAELGATAVQQAELSSALVTKQDVISDLATIRSGAALGATAIQQDEFSSALATKQDFLVNQLNVKSINGASILGSGNLTVGAALPTQTGHSGAFLTTDGMDASWAMVDALPGQATHSGSFLTTDGSDASWTPVYAMVIREW